MNVVPADLVYFGPELLVLGGLLGLFSILVLFAANYCINFAIAWVLRKHLKTERRPSYAVLALVTLLGLVMDAAAFFLGSVVTESPFLRTSFIGLFVLLGMAATTYGLIYKNELDSKDALVASLAFGVISNPVWLLIALPLLSPGY